LNKNKKKMKNLRFAFHMLKRNPLLLYISIPGLAVGLCAVLLLAVHLKYEFSFDKHFSTGDRVLRLCNVLYDQDKTSTLSIGLRTAYTQLPAQVPEVEKAVQIYPELNSTVKTEQGTFGNINLLYADPEFFDVFGLKLFQGNISDALIGKNNIVLTKSTAEKLLGTGDYLGKTVKINDRQLIVTGVINDIPKTTHFKFDMLMPLESHEFIAQQGSLEFRTYYLIKEGANLEKAGQNIAAANDKLMPVWKRRGSLNEVKTETITESLRDIHLHTKASGDLVPKTNLSQLLIVIGIAVFILLIALINFINMYLLHGEKRISEIASRKVAGASRTELALQFYLENSVIAFIALVLGLGLAVLVQPFFAKMINLPLTVSDMFTPLGIIMIVTILVALVLISGAYPSFYLSKINMLSGLKGKHRHISNGRFSKAVVLVQFFITVLLISSVVIIRAQIKYMEDVPLGFNASNVTAVTDFSERTAKNAQNIKKELEKLPFIQSIGLSEHSMGGRCSGQGISLLSNDEAKPIKEYRVFSGFCETMQIKLLDGKFFTENANDKKSIILNKAAAQMLGLQFTEGMQVVYKGEPVEVKGIVNDFYYDGYAGKTIEPLVICRVDSRAWNFYLRTNDKFTADNRKQVAALFKQFDPENVMTFTPLGDIYNLKFEKDKRVFRMVSSGAYLAIILSFVGMLSLTVMNVARRTKEIGIRKVIGSSEREIVSKLMGETLLLVSISSLFAFGVSYYLMREWLSNFVLKINLHIGYFLLSGFFAFAIVILAVSWQSWKAATRNPMEALRYE
jgi:putative ABC transport system permease protein